MHKFGYLEGDADTLQHQIPHILVSQQTASNTIAKSLQKSNKSVVGAHEPLDPSPAAVRKVANGELLFERRAGAGMMTGLPATGERSLARGGGLRVDGDDVAVGLGLLVPPAPRGLAVLTLGETV